MANRSAVADFHHLPYLRKGTLSCTPFAYLGTKNRTGTRHIGGVQDYGFYGSTSNEDVVFSLCYNVYFLIVLNSS